MRRAALLLALAACGLALAAAAQAHPLGNFTINRYSRVEPSGDRVYVLYVLDMAEIPTFQARGEVAREGVQAYAARLSRSIARGVELRANGEPVRLRATAHVLAFPPGQAGLQTTRLEVLLVSTPLPRIGRDQLLYSDRNYSSRIGWKEIMVEASSGARVLDSSAPSSSISHELLAYPKNLLQSPLDVQEARAVVVPGSGAGSPPALIPKRVLERRVAVRAVADGGFASLIARGHLSAGVILVSLALALFWGAAHALTPGHGKSIVAAYLVGQRGKPRHAVLLGGIVTATHTVGVFALGLVTLLLSQFIVPEALYPWLNLIAAVLVVGIGLSVLGSRLRVRSAPTHQHHPDHAHGHDHSHGAPRSLSARSLVAVGVSGGLLPCPSALVVLLAAISLHRLAFGLILIVAFSLGLAVTISSIGLTAVLAKRLFSRMSLEGRLVRLLPAVSALAILTVGTLMTARALSRVA